MYLNNSDKESLKMFNEKVDEMYFSGFPFSAFSYYNNHKGFMETSLVNGKITSIDVFSPNGNELNSFILTYKVLTQKSNHCSFVSMAAIYNKLPDTVEQKKKFNFIRDEINNFLGSDSGMFESETHWKRREVVDYMMNALYAHVDKNKKLIVDRWLSHHPFSEKFCRYIFVETLFFVSDRLFQIKIVNDSLIKDNSLFDS